MQLLSRIFSAVSTILCSTYVFYSTLTAGRRVCGVGAPYSGRDGEGGAVFSGVNLTAVGIMQCDRSK